MLPVIEYTTKLDFILEKLNAAHQGESGSGLATTAECAGAARADVRGERRPAAVEKRKAR